MIKKTLMVAMAVLLTLSLASCGPKPIESAWEYVSGDSSLVGIKIPYSLTFKNGKMTIAATFEDAGLSPSDEAFAREMTQLASFTYVIISDTEIKITLSVSTINYSDTKTYAYMVDGDTLTLDGVTFRRK
jgi:uncharacterized lipoprotein YehR (DUF1307 family)